MNRRPEQRSVGSRYRESKHKHGENHPSARYPDDIVDTIRRLYRLGEHGYLKLSQMFGIPKTTVRGWVKYQRRMRKTVVTREVNDGEQ